MQNRAHGELYVSLASAYTSTSAKCRLLGKTSSNFLKDHVMILDHFITCRSQGVVWPGSIYTDKSHDRVVAMLDAYTLY